VSPLPYPYSALGLLVFGDANTNATAAIPYDALDAEAAGTGEIRGRAAWKGLSICTGWLVSPDLVITAAHCLYSVASSTSKGGLTDRKPGFRKVIAFYPSYSRSESGVALTPFGKVEALWSDVLPEWVEHANAGRFFWRGDVGAVKLASKVRSAPARVGWLC